MKFAVQVAAAAPTLLRYDGARPHPDFVPMSIPAAAPSLRAAPTRLGVYIHFPYCQKHCPYCDFAVAVRKQIPHEHYLRAIRAELAAKAPLFAGSAAVSVYLGGGTPSLWQPDCIAAAIDAVLAVFPPAAGCQPEITLECDPAGLSADTLHQLRRIGVNRLSIGAQSLQPRHLVQLGRQHAPDDIPRLVAQARATGFENLSIDLMIGLIDQKRAELDDDLRRLLELRPEHVSLYQLTIEPGTALAAAVRRGQTSAPTDEQQADAYDRVREVLDPEYQHYEISSFARRPAKDRPDIDYRARHNRLYWTLGDYLGLGVSAHSFRRRPEGGGERFANIRGVESYLGVWGGTTPPARFSPSDAAAPGLSLYEHRDPEALAREGLWLGLRALTGLSRTDFAAVHGYDPLLRHHAPIADQQGRGLLVVEGDWLRLTRRGALFADEVGAVFL